MARSIREVGTQRLVERILSGSFASADLSDFLLHLRYRSYGVRSVKDIGDLIAHVDERNQGVLNDHVRDWVACVRFEVWKLERNGPLDLNDAHPELPTVLKTTLKQVSSDKLREQLGLNRKKTKRLLKTILAKFHRKENGRYRLEPLDRQELDVVRVLASFFVVRPAFEAESVAKDFWCVLNKNGYVTQSQKTSFEAVFPTICLFIMAKMQGCKILINEATPTELLAQIGGMPDQFLQVSFSVPACRKRNIYFASNIFSTTMRAAEHCEADLLADWSANAEWPHPIELSSEVKLQRM